MTYFLCLNVYRDCVGFDKFNGSQKNLYEKDDKHFLQMQIPKDAFDKINLVHRKFYIYKGSQAFFCKCKSIVVWPLSASHISFIMRLQDIKLFVNFS